MSLVFRIICATITLLITLASLPALAMTPVTIQYLSYHDEQPTFVRHESDNSRELDLNYIQKLNQLAQKELKMSVADFVPRNLKDSDSQAKIARQIIGHSVERWFSSHEIANGSIGEVIRNIDRPMSHGMQTKDASGVNHKVSVNVKAARAIASVNYSGYVDASIAYQVTSNSLGVEISRCLNTSQKVVLTHTSHAHESRQILAWQMSW